MQILIILAVLGALAVAENAPAEPLQNPGWRLAASLLLMALPVLAAWWISWITVLALRVGRSSRARIIRRFQRLRTLHAVLWLTAAAAVLWSFGWGQLIKFNFGLDRFVLVDDLLILTPVLLPMVLSWLAFYEVDRALRQTARDWARSFVPAGGVACSFSGDGTPPSTHGVATLALSSPIAAASPPAPSRRAYIDFQLRTVMGIALAPLLLMLAAQDVARLLWPEWLVGPHGWTVLLPPLVLLVGGFPLLLRHVWRTAPLPAGPLRSRLEAVARQFKLPVREILVWQTGGQLLNAAVAGFLPGWRYVFLTDSLLDQLNDDEIEAVFGHEVGHIRHRHVLLRALVLLVPVSLWSLCRTAMPDLDPIVASVDAAGWGATALSGLAAVAALGIYIAGAFGFCSRRFERQADLFGCRVASWGSANDDSTSPTADGLTPAGIQTFIGALEKLASINGVGRRTPSWQHSSIALRVAFLEQVATDHQQEALCHRQVRLLGLLLTLLVAAGFVAPFLH